MERSKRSRIRNIVQLRENVRAQAVRQRSLMLLKDYRMTRRKDDPDQGDFNQGGSRAPRFYPSVEQTASKYGGNSRDKISTTVYKHHTQTQSEDRTKVEVKGTATNARSNKIDLGNARDGNMQVDRRKLEEHPAIIHPPSKREKKKILHGREEQVSVRSRNSKGQLYSGPSTAVGHVCHDPNETCPPCLRVTYHSAGQKRPEGHSRKDIPLCSTVAEESDKDNYLKLESTERKIKDFLRRTSAVAASRSNNDIMEKESSHDDLLAGFVGPDERKRQFSKVYHLEPPRALSGLSGTTNSPVDSYSSPVHDRSDSPLILPPLTLPPIRQQSTQREQRLLQIGAPEKARKPLTGREWRQLKKCRYLRLGPNRQDPNMRELSLQEVFSSNLPSK